MKISYATCLTESEETDQKKLSDLLDRGYEFEDEPEESDIDEVTRSQDLPGLAEVYRAYKRPNY